MKFWNKAGNDIYIYGDIVSERYEDSEVTAKSFLEDLKLCAGAVNVHINSAGGDVFQAQAIYNVLKSYDGEVTITIDGLAASAASLIVCAGDKVKMARNGLIMIHRPTAALLGWYDSADLEKAVSGLKAVEGSILETYKMKLPTKSHAQVTEMMLAETWLTADESKELGFADEIIGEVEMELDAVQDLLIVNKQAFECKKLGSINLKGVKKLETKKSVIDEAVKQARAEELLRIKNLMALKGENAAVNAIIDTALSEGSQVEEVKKYIDAVKNVSIPDKNSAVEEVKSVIRDNLQSGAEGVGGSIEGGVDEKRMILAKSLAEMANSLRGGAKRG